jgi:hypothetical protein
MSYLISEFTPTLKPEELRKIGASDLRQAWAALMGIGYAQYENGNKTLLWALEEVAPFAKPKIKEGK